MLPEFSASPVVTSVTGFGLLIFSWKVLLPLLKQFLETQSVHGKAANQMVVQLSDELTKALARADSAEKRADGYFESMADMKGQISLLNYQLQVSAEHITRLEAQLKYSDERVELLTQKLNILIGDKDV